MDTIIRLLVLCLGLLFTSCDKEPSSDTSGEAVILEELKTDEILIHGATDFYSKNINLV